MGSSSIEALRAQVRGQVITPAEADFDEARAVHNGMFDRRPAVVIRAEQTTDVVAGVNHARDNDMTLSVRGGGHSAPGFGTNDDGVVIDLSRMNGIQIDAAARIARAGGGATWGKFNEATHAHGLATTGGLISTTGIGGLTLGGGIGYLARGHGLSIDNLVGAEVVTADGRIVRADAGQNEDLFWALRGGGGNFGVVTTFEFALHPVETVYAGPIFYEAEHARELFRFYRSFVADAPEEFGGFPAWQIAPPLGFIPSDRHGDTFCAAVVHWAGDVDEGRRALKPFFDLAPVVAEDVGPRPYPALNAAFDGLFPKGIRSYWKGTFARELTDQAIDVHLEHGPKVPEFGATMHVYPINGACHRIAPDATAWGYRDASFATVIVAAWEDPAKDQSRIRWVRDYYDALVPHSQAGGYVNFMAEDDAHRVADNYGPNYERLVEVKTAWDPQNLFDQNQNIRPATSHRRADA